jgi:hypothetical protein
MWPYFVLFLIPACLAIQRKRLTLPAILWPTQTSKRRWPTTWHLVFWALSLLIGLRHEVGGDWLSYLNNIEDAVDLGFWEALAHKDPSYGLLIWLGVHTGTDIYLVNTVCGLLFSYGLMEFCRAQPRPWLAFTVAVPYLVIVVAMGYTRQGVAIGLVMAGLVAIERGGISRFIFWIILAATFHKSAVILVPLALLAVSKHRVWSFVLVALSATLLFVLLLQESVDQLRSGYIDAAYESSGAAVRVTMNALPGALFLIFRKRFRLSPVQNGFWGGMSWGGILFVLLLAVSPSSTAVDRLALYWIPLQLYVWSRLPEVLGSASASNRIWSIAVVFFSGSVMLTWLFFGVHADGWIPYRFYPLVYLWK